MVLRIIRLVPLHTWKPPDELDGRRNLSPQPWWLLCRSRLQRHEISSTKGKKSSQQAVGSPALQQNSDWTPADQHGTQKTMSSEELVSFWTYFGKSLLVFHVGLSRQASSVVAALRLHEQIYWLMPEESRHWHGLLNSTDFFMRLPKGGFCFFFGFPMNKVP